MYHKNYINSKNNINRYTSCIYDTINLFNNLETMVDNIINNSDTNISFTVIDTFPINMVPINMVPINNYKPHKSTIVIEEIQDNLNNNKHNNTEYIMDVKQNTQQNTQPDIKQNTQQKTQNNTQQNLMIDNKEFNTYQNYQDYQDYQWNIKTYPDGTQVKVLSDHLLDKLVLDSLKN